MSNSFKETEAKKLALSKIEIRILKKLKTPALIQGHLNSLPFRFSPDPNEPYFSPRLVMRNKRAQCIEGAMFAYLALRLHGYRTYLMDLASEKPDDDHVVAIFKVGRRWGAISKTNHAVLRYREPVYSTPREIAMSYFHEYFLDNGRKTMRTYSKPFSLKKFDKRDWATSGEDLEYIGKALDKSSHIKIMTPTTIKNLRKADKVEIEAGKVTEWKK